jgi:hypothetical protein
LGRALIVSLGWVFVEFAVKKVSEKLVTSGWRMARINLIPFQGQKHDILPEGRTSVSLRGWVDFLSGFDSALPVLKNIFRKRFERCGHESFMHSMSHQIPI